MVLGAQRAPCLGICNVTLEIPPMRCPQAQNAPVFATSSLPFPLSFVEKEWGTWRHCPDPPLQHTAVLGRQFLRALYRISTPL